MWEHKFDGEAEEGRHPEEQDLDDERPPELYCLRAVLVDELI
jgi:hypothetical protein